MVGRTESCLLSVMTTTDPELAIAYAKFFGRLQKCRVRVFDRAVKALSRLPHGKGSVESCDVLCH